MRIQQKIRHNKLAAAILIYIVWVFAFSYIHYSEQKSRLYSQTDEELLSAAQVAPLLLPDALHHQAMSAVDLSPEQDIKNIERLSAYTDKSAISYIYTLYLSGDDIVFTSSSATLEERQTGEGLSPYFSVYDDADPRVLDAFSHVTPIFIEYTDKWGSFRSVFLPLDAADGTRYLAAADMSISEINAVLKQEIAKSVFFSLLFLAFLYPVYRVKSQGFKQSKKQLEQAVQLQSKQLLNSNEYLTLALENGKQGWFDVNLQTGDISVNDGYYALLGYKPNEISFSLENWQNSLHPEDRQQTLTTFQQAIASNISHEGEYRRLTKQGTYTWFHTIGQVMEWDEDGKPLRFVGINTNINQRKQHEQILLALAQYGGSRNTSQTLQKIVAEIAASFAVEYVLVGKLVDAKQVQTLVVWAGGKLGENIRYDLRHTPCHNVIDQQHCFYPNDVQALFPKDDLLKVMRVDSYLGVPLMGQNGQSIGLLAILDTKPMTFGSSTEMLLKTIAVRIAIELDRAEDEAKLRLSSQVFESAHEGITITDTKGIILDVNPTFCEITGYDREEIIGQSSRILQSDKHTETFYQTIWQNLREQGHWQGEVWNRKKNGEVYPQMLSMSAITDDHDLVTNYIGLFSDISAIKEQQASLELMAHYDALTGLPNRTLFADRFSQATAHSNRSQSKLAICFLDLDDFKPVNDRYGHETGDELLINVAHRLSTTLRDEDTVCRFGGDEFALLIRDVTSIEHCHDTMSRIFNVLCQPYLIGQHTIECTPSCGITLFPNDNSDLDTLIRHADQAMYQSKLAGRNQYTFYNAEDEYKATEKNQQLYAIDYGLDHDQFELHYQPKVDARTGKVFGVEALIRWHHPEKGLQFPDSFLPIIEGTHLESKLGLWVLDHALKQLLMWNKQNIDLEVSINICSNHLQSDNFTQQLAEVMDKYPEVNSQHIQLEILESSALGDIDAVKAIIKTCQDSLGIQIALDDFGTGYSSLTHLRNLSARTIKIDRSFVRDLLDDPNDFAIIEGIIGLTNSFNRDLIAEGVETTEHGLMLLTMGCHKFQGYGIAKPMPATEVLPWLEQFEIKPEWLNHTQQRYSAKDINIIQYQLLANNWMAFLERAVTTKAPNNTYSWPILNAKRCFHTVWLKRAREDRLFNPQQYRKIEQTHNSLHAQTDGLVESFNMDKNAYYASEIELIKQTHNKLMGLITQA